MLTGLLAPLLNLKDDGPTGLEAGVDGYAMTWSRGRPLLPEHKLYNFNVIR